MSKESLESDLSSKMEMIANDMMDQNKRSTSWPIFIVVENKKVYGIDPSFRDCERERKDIDYIDEEKDLLAILKTLTFDMPKKLTKEEKQAILKKTSDDMKAGVTRSDYATSVSGKPYSVFNQCFLVNQEAVPGVFGGFHQWRKASRMVKKGEHGYYICFPIRQYQKEEQMNEIMKEDKPHFAIVSVFHFDQTEPMDADTDPELTHALASGAIVE